MPFRMRDADGTCYFWLISYASTAQRCCKGGAPSAFAFSTASKREHFSVRRNALSVAWRLAAGCDGRRSGHAPESAPPAF